MFQISVVNEHFHSSNDHDCPTEEAARKHAIVGALAIAAEEVANGNPFFAAEVAVDLDGTRVSRWVVSVGASPLRF